MSDGARIEFVGQVQQPFAAQGVKPLKRGTLQVLQQLFQAAAVGPLRCGAFSVDQLAQQIRLVTCMGEVFGNLVFVDQQGGVETLDVDFRVPDAAIQFCQND